MFVLIGSMAIKDHYPDFRNNNDVDFIGRFSDFKDITKWTSNKLIRTKSSPECWNYFTKDDGDNLVIFEAFKNINTNSIIYDMMYDKNKQWKSCDSDISFMLKMSHRFRRVKSIKQFEKTRNDILFLRSKGHTKIRDDLQDLYKERVRETYNYSHPKLNMTKNQFFDDSVSYIYDHDSIHEAIKISQKPAYEYFKPDKNDVFCSREMFESLDHQTKLNSVYEESAVLCLERSIIPHGRENIKSKFNYSLVKVCTSITSGWFRDFAWENYDEIMKMYSEDFITKFDEGIKNSTIKHILKV